MRDRSQIGNRWTARHRFLCQMAGELKGEKILDLGCGFGWFEEYAVSKDCDTIVGVDADHKMIERARREVPGGEFINGDITGIKFHPGTFSVVSMFDVLEHLPIDGVVPLLVTSKLLLKQGGRILMSVPYCGALSTALDPAFYLGHRHYRLSNLKKYLDEAELKMSRVSFAGGLWESVSMIWLYFSKWVLGREMPFAEYLERKRTREYGRVRSEPDRASLVTMFVEAVLKGPSDA